MGWCTYVNAEIVFNRETYDDICKVEDEIENQEKLILMARDNLIALAALNPEVIAQEPKDEEEAVNTEEIIRHRVSDNIETLTDAVISKYRLNLLRENYDDVEGDFIEKSDHKLTIMQSDVKRLINFISSVPGSEEYVRLLNDIDIYREI